MLKSLCFKFIGAWHFQTIIEEIIDRHSVRSFSSLLCPMHRKLKSIWTVSAVCLFSYIQPVVGILWHPKQFLPVLSKLESFSLLFWLNLPYSSLYSCSCSIPRRQRELLLDLVWQALVYLKITINLLFYFTLYGLVLSNCNQSIKLIIN